MQLTAGFGDLADVWQWPRNTACGWGQAPRVDICTLSVGSQTLQRVELQLPCVALFLPRQCALLSHDRLSAFLCIRLWCSSALSLLIKSLWYLVSLLGILVKDVSCCSLCYFPALPYYHLCISTLSLSRGMQAECGAAGHCQALEPTVHSVHMYHNWDQKKAWFCPAALVGACQCHKCSPNCIQRHGGPVRWLYAEVQSVFNESPSGGLVHAAALVQRCSSLDVLPCFELEQWRGLCAPSVLLRSDRVTIHTQVEVTGLWSLLQMPLPPPQASCVTLSSYYFSCYTT